MKIKNKVSLGRLVGKVDNDFNISESDWIPRVAAWTIDALAQMKILPFEKKRRKLEVSDRVAIYPCDINGKELKVFDKSGRTLTKAVLSDATKYGNKAINSIGSMLKLMDTDTLKISEKFSVSNK